MPAIKSSADLRNNYPEPVFITKNGKGDLAVISIEAYEELTSRFELYSQIKEGRDDIMRAADYIEFTLKNPDAADNLLDAVFPFRNVYCSYFSCPVIHILENISMNSLQMLEIKFTIYWFVQQFQQPKHCQLPFK